MNKPIHFSVRLSVYSADFLSREQHTQEYWGSLEEAVSFGQSLVAAVATFLPEETPIFLNVTEEDNLVCPSFHMGRYNTPEDAPIVLPQ